MSLDTFDERRWLRIAREQLGIDAIDTLGHRIGPGRATSGPGGPWSPVSELKQILVGELDHYGFYNPGGIQSSDEADFNISITPSAPFRFTLDDVVKRMSEDEREDLIKRTRGPGFCVQCEITPDEHFYGNPYFGTEHGSRTSVFTGLPIGVYGPWVHDQGHSGRPEIHPCEVIWVKMISFLRPRIRSSWLIFVLQDDSNRFDRTSDYAGSVLRPWSKPPRVAQVDVALEFPRRELTTYSLTEEFGRKVAVLPNADTPTLTGSFGDKVVVRLVKHLGDPRHVRAELGPIVSADQETLRCFLRLLVQVGEGDRGDEGYIVLRLEEIPARERESSYWLEPALHMLRS